MRTEVLEVQDLEDETALVLVCEFWEDQHDAIRVLRSHTITEHRFIVLVGEDFINEVHERNKLGQLLMAINVAMSSYAERQPPEDIEWFFDT